MSSEEMNRQGAEKSRNEENKKRKDLPRRAQRARRRKQEVTEETEITTPLLSLFPPVQNCVALGRRKRIHHGATEGTEKKNEKRGEGDLCDLRYLLFLPPRCVVVPSWLNTSALVHARKFAQEAKFVTVSNTEKRGGRGSLFPPLSPVQKMVHHAMVGNILLIRQ
jgi:hypothetical protein